MKACGQCGFGQEKKRKQRQTIYNNFGKINSALSIMSNNEPNNMSLGQIYTGSSPIQALNHNNNIPNNLLSNFYLNNPEINNMVQPVTENVTNEPVSYGKRKRSRSRSRSTPKKYKQRKIKTKKSRQIKTFRHRHFSKINTTTNNIMANIEPMNTMSFAQSYTGQSPFQAQMNSLSPNLKSNFYNNN